MMCIHITRQRLGKHIPVTHAHATIEHLLICSGQVNTLPLQYRDVSVGSVPRVNKGAKKVA
jgi:hypothetical protein